MIYKPSVISKARGSVRRLLLLCTIGFCGSLTSDF
jgi:hypothetical protein